MINQKSLKGMDEILDTYDLPVLRLDKQLKQTHESWDQSNPPKKMTRPRCCKMFK